MMWPARYPTHARRKKSSTITSTKLEEIIRPIGKLTYYAGVLPEWCYPLPRKKRCCLVIQWTTCALFCLSLLFMCVFQFIQLVKAFLESTPVTDLIGNLMWCSPYPLNIAAFIAYIYRRENMLSFFKEWERFERLLCANAVELNNSSTKRWSRVIYVCYLFVCLSLICGLFHLATSQPDKSYFLSHYSFFKDFLGVTGAAVFQVLFTVPVAWIYQFLSDAVPGFVFHHSAMVLHSLENEFRRSFLTLNLNNIANPFNPKVSEVSERFSTPFCRKFRYLWTQYETLSKLTKQANNVFSLVIAIDHLVKLFMICSVVFGFLNDLRNPTSNMTLYVFGSLAFTFRLVACALMSAKIHAVSQELKECVSLSLSCYCHMLSQEECELVALFLSRLEQDKLTARPLNMYDITPPMLLTLASVIITYVIVLVQSK